MEGSLQLPPEPNHGTNPPSGGSPHTHLAPVSQHSGFPGPHSGALGAVPAPAPAPGPRPCSISPLTWAARPEVRGRRPDDSFPAARPPGALGAWHTKSSARTAHRWRALRGDGFHNGLRGAGTGRVPLRLGGHPRNEGHQHMSRSGRGAAPSVRGRAARRGVGSGSERVAPRPPRQQSPHRRAARGGLQLQVLLAPGAAAPE